MRIIAPTLLMIILVAACSKAGSDVPYCYAHDSKRREIPKLYLVNDSRGHKVTTKADDALIWNGIVKKPDFVPNIHPVGIPPDLRQKCRVRITGRPYTVEREVDWQKGKALIVHFGDDRVTFTQQEEPVRFQ